ncbi:uncharacterized protein [Rutidosis leptorrhynchoides]|uniref:uncharacterized protein n=1 Tax=Rutidosis leptorrhynchoides TaxID=125765 RepID=UPI003A99257F
MWETFKQVKINLPLLDAIKQVPSYAKFLKDLCTQKRKQRASLPQKGELTEHLRAIVPVHFHVTLRTHGPRLMKRTNIIIQLADQSIKTPRGMLEDVIVKVEDFYYPLDFIVMDIEHRNKDAQPTIILGRPFLATINAHINCRTGAMDISFENRKMRIKIFNSLHAPCVHECYQVDIIDEQVEKHASHLITNDLVEVFCLGDEDDTECEEVKAVELAIASKMDSRLPPWTHKYEPLPKSIDTNTKPSLESPPTLELKPLPSHLKYAFFSTNGTLPVIIASVITGLQE